MRTRTAGSRAVLLAGCVLALACGKRGDPRPPLRRVPPPLAGFHVAQRGARLEVSATAPRASTDGAPYTSLRVEILRAEGEGDFVKLARTRAITVGAGETFREPDSLPAPGTRLRLGARAVASGKPSALTALTDFVVQPPLTPPAELTAVVAPDGIRLTWSGKPPAPLPPPPPPPAPVTAPAATPPATPTSAPAAPTAAPSAVPAPPTPPPPPPPKAGFWIYRRPAKGAYDRPLFAEPTLAQTAVDAQATLGEDWCYVARAVVSQEPVIESDSSNEACATAKDVAAPAPPAGLTALAEPGVLEIRWSPSLESDLATYRVYRAAANGTPQLLADIPAGTTVYRDQSVAPATPYRYTVTAVDTAGNESLPSSPLLGNSP